MPVTLGTVVSIIGLIFAAASAGAAVIYGYGRLNKHGETLQRDIDKHERDLNELFQRIRDIEGISTLLKDCVDRLEKILGNGITQNMRNLELRLERLETHCADVHSEYNFIKDKHA